MVSDGIAFGPCCVAVFADVIATSLRTSLRLRVLPFADVIATRRAWRNPRNSKVRPRCVACVIRVIRRFALVALLKIVGDRWWMVWMICSGGVVWTGGNLVAVDLRSMGCCGSIVLEDGAIRGISVMRVMRGIGRHGLRSMLRCS